ncbi:MAG: NAD(P)-binding protein [Gammaproteobacteria bacterium]
MMNRQIETISTPLVPNFEKPKIEIENVQHRLGMDSKKLKNDELDEIKTESHTAEMTITTTTTTTTNRGRSDRYDPYQIPLMDDEEFKDFVSIYGKTSMADLPDGLIGRICERLERVPRELEQEEFDPERALDDSNISITDDELKLLLGDLQTKYFSIDTNPVTPQLQSTMRGKTIVVLGGGTGGLVSARTLSKNFDCTVSVLEKNEELYRGASDINPGRAAHGFHYIHAYTGLLCLLSTLSFAKTSPDCFLGSKHEDDIDHFTHHGYYAIPKEAKDFDQNKFNEEQVEKFKSQNSHAEIFEVYRIYKRAYRLLCEEDQANKVFGEPEDFCRLLDVKASEGILDTDIIAHLVDTREELVDKSKLRKSMIDAVSNNDKIQVHTNAEVTRIIPYYQGLEEEIPCRANNEEKIEEGDGAVMKQWLNGSEDVPSPLYVVEYKSVSEAGDITFNYLRADVVINATWENVDALSLTANRPLQPGFITNRLKALSSVNLPEELREHPSVFVVGGPHTMFSNMADGTGRVTYAPETNIEVTDKAQMPKRMARYLDQRAENTDSEEQVELADRGRRIIEGSAQYIKPLADQKSTGAFAGVVQHEGSYDASNLSSPHHSRSDVGVSLTMLGLITVAPRKLFYMAALEPQALKKLTQSIKAQEEINVIINLFNRYVSGDDSYKFCLFSVLSMMPKQLLDKNFRKEFNKVAKSKFALNQQISQLLSTPETKAYDFESPEEASKIIATNAAVFFTSCLLPSTLSDDRKSTYGRHQKDQHSTLASQEGRVGRSRSSSSEETHLSDRYHMSSLHFMNNNTSQGDDIDQSPYTSDSSGSENESPHSGDNTPGFFTSKEGNYEPTAPKKGVVLRREFENGPNQISAKFSEIKSSVIRIFSKKT